MNGEDYFSSRRTESRVATWHHKQARAKLLSCQSLEKNEKENKKPFVQDVLTTRVNFLEQQGNGKWTRKIFSSRCTESWIILLLDITSQHVLACARPSNSIVGTYKNEPSENKKRTTWERGRWRRQKCRPVSPLPPPPLPPSPPPSRVFRISYYWMTFQHHLGAWNRLTRAYWVVLDYKTLEKNE